MGQRGVVAQHGEPKPKKRRLRKLLITIAIIAVVIFLLVGVAFPKFVLWGMREGRTAFEVNDQTLAEMSPIDADQLANLASLPQGDPDDTWAVYVYMVGSDLESLGRDNLSDTTDILLKDGNAAYTAAQDAAMERRIQDFSETVTANGSFLPTALTEPNYDKGVEKKEGKYDGVGCATLSLREMMKADLGDQVQIVVQTGGSRAWDTPDVNPNRTQRFVVGNGRINEVYNGELENMGDPETLTGFLNYCEANYPADHTIVIMWDHGGAMNGFGWDEIHADDNLTLKELREGFSGAYAPNEDNPPIDLLYFNACLLSNAETINSVRGFASYMLACEEVEVGAESITYLESAFNALSENPAMHPAQFGQVVIDNYIRTVMELTAIQGYVQPISQGVVDLTKAAKAYDAYGEFVGAVLDKTIEQPGYLVLLNRAAKSSTFFAQSSYKNYNTIDLHNFMDGVSDYFPDETAAVQAAIEESIVYARATSYLRDAGGISVYFPAYIETPVALNYMLRYVEDINDNPDIDALYYYKVAGCMTDEMESYVESRGYGDVQALDYETMRQCSGLEISVDAEGNITGQIPDAALPLSSDAYLQLARVDEQNNQIIYLGEDRYIGFDEAGRLFDDFEGEWVSIGDEAYPVSIIDADDEDIKYQTHIRFKEFNRYLVSRFIFDTEEMEILGIREYKDAADTLDRNLTAIAEKDTISPVYRTSDLDGGNQGTFSGTSLKFSDSAAITDAPLADGTYYMRVVIEDLRSDKYYSQIVQFTMKGGSITDAHVNPSARMLSVG